MVLLNHFHRFSILVILKSTPAFAGVLSFFDPNNFNNQETNFHLHLQSFFTNDAFSIQTRLNKMVGESNAKNGENLEIIDIRFDSGYSYQPFGYIGYIYRNQTAISASKDMAELYHSTKNKIDLEVERKYNLKLQTDSFKLEGFIYANSFSIYHTDSLDIRFGGAIELLFAKKMQDWQMSGTAEAISAKDYNLNIISDSHYTKNYLYKLQVPQSNATGYSSHLSLNMHYKKIKVSLLINDIWSKLKWEKLPYSYVKMKTENKTYDANGYVKYQPSISGIEKNVDYTQTLIRKWKMNVQYFFDTSSILIGSEYIYSNYIPYIMYKYKFTPNFSTSIEYEFKFKSYYSEIRYKNYYLGIRANHLNEQNTLALNLGINF